MAERTIQEPASVTEQLSYRLRKWGLQRLTSSRDADQHRRLLDRDWDVLVVLDACRLDTLRKVANWPVEQVSSPASCTPDWLESIVSNNVFSDSTVLTANPQYEKFEFDGVVDHFWKTHWQDRVGTVLPEPVLREATDRLADESPVVAHLQQPHWPYVARIGDTWQLAYNDLGPWGEDDEIRSTQVAMARGEIDIRRAQRAYEASVASVWAVLMPYVAEWLDDGYRAIVTADHGESFAQAGDIWMCEHPCGCHISSLTSVPWIEFSPSNPPQSADTETGVVEDRLEALGYVD